MRLVEAIQVGGCMRSGLVEETSMRHESYRFFSDRRNEEYFDDADTITSGGGRNRDRPRSEPRDRAVAERAIDRLQSSRSRRCQSKRRDQGDEHGDAAQGP